MIVYEFYERLLSEKHLLIAGATGTGKSVIVNGMIYTIMLGNPKEKQIILIDPKRSELTLYRDSIYTIAYACEKESMYKALCLAMDICETRYKYMARNGLKMYNGSDIYVFIDELADLLTTDKKRVHPLLQRLGQIARASKIHLIVCTQICISKIISTELKCNYDSRIALRTACKQDSRNIIGIPDAAYLPEYGQCLYKTPLSIQKWKVPYYTEETLQELAFLRSRTYCQYLKPPKKKKFLGIF